MSMKKAVSAAMRGPEVKKLKVFDHEFNVKPAEITRDGKNVTVIGQISHCLRFLKDDQFYYAVRKEGDKIMSLDIKIARGGATPIVAPIGAAVASLVLKQPVPPEKVAEIGRMLGGQIHGSWEAAAEVIASEIAIRA